METAQQEERRKHPRFSDRILAGAQVQLVPVAPFYGEVASGYLIDLSAGGMGIVLPDLIPKNVFLQMSMTLPDGFNISSVITVRRIVKQGSYHDFLHGIEFLNPAPEMIERIELMARDILKCNDRTKAGEKEICVASCTLRTVCKRPQRVEKDVRPALIKFTQELKTASHPPVLTEVTPDEVEEFWKAA